MASTPRSSAVVTASVWEIDCGLSREGVGDAFAAAGSNSAKIVAIVSAVLEVVLTSISFFRNEFD